jgi:rod shape-determining protein MreD
VSILLSLPVLAFVLMLQTIIVSTLPLLSGYADLVLLVLVAWSLQERARSAWIWAIVAGVLVGFVSAAPTGTPLVGYLVVTAIARLFRRRVMQTPVLSMFLVTFVGSLVTQGLVAGALIFKGVPLPINDSINLVILPSTLLNLLLALPIYAIVSDLAQWVYPEEVEV